MPQNTYTKAPRSRIGVLFGEMVPLFIIVVLPFSVHAGVFSSLMDMISQDVVIYDADHADVLIQDVKLLSATNNPDPKGALGGGEIIIDGGALVAGGTLGEDEMNQAKTFSGEISVYVVREGDSLSQIAEMYDVTANTILWANDIKSGVIQPGQSLVILPIVGVRHVVKSKDTLSTIAKKYDAEIEEILEYNQMASSDQLSVGDTLVIPGGEIAAPVRVVTRSSRGVSSGSGSAGFSHPAPGAVRTQGIHGYNGVDLAGPGGARLPIRAAAAGQVIVSKGSGWNGGYGNYIVIKHNNGTQTLYSHMSSNSVGVGAYVAAGQAIGVMGSTGRSTGVHLHFEVRGARNPF
ncbi:MAG: LysM repeat protein [Candidatus Azotimanducaceae bacterium]